MKVEAQGGEESGIYSITNTIDNRVYIGSSLNIEKRKLQHIQTLKRNVHCNNHLQRFVNKYGLETLQFNILEKCALDDLVPKEQHYMDNADNLFNISKIAGRIEMNEETKQKMSLLHKGRILPEYQKENLRQINLGKKLSLETKKKLSEHMKYIRSTIIWPSCKGEKNSQSKLTDLQVLDIKKMLSEKVKQVNIAKMYNVSKSCISYINKNKSYKHLEYVS